MSQCFSFRFNRSEKSNRPSLVLYFEKKISLDAISRVIKKDVTDHLTPERVYLVTSASAQYMFDEINKDRAFYSEFLSYVGDVNNYLTLLRSTSDGEIVLPDNKPEDVATSQRLLHHGMLSLFKKHRGLIVSNSSYHFVKPSGAHCDSFIRASNLLVSSNEVSFLAISLLPHLKAEIKRIYVDTSSISFLISIAIRLCGKYSSETPSIESFESYAALNKPYDFVEDNSSLVIISATTSGSLASKLISEKRLHHKNVITLFHLGLPNGQVGLFNIKDATPEKPISVSPSECEFCKRESRLIHIDGEQFLPESPRHELLLIRKADFNKSREKFFQKFAATGTLEWNKTADPSAASTEHFFINAQQAINTCVNALGDNFKKTVKRYVTRDLTNIIVLEDQDSKALLSAIQNLLDERSTQQIPVTDVSAIESISLETCGSVMVVAAAITSGRQLLSISRKLRSLNSSSSILYLVAFSKLPSREAKDQLCSDLQQGGNTLIILEPCSLPRIKEHAKTAWDWERDALSPLSESDPLGDANNKLPAMLQERLECLTTASASADDLFLRIPGGGKLKLRKTFAFWSDLGFDDARFNLSTQADVYWTIQAILHDLRSNNEKKSLATPYHTTLLSPANFDRFNDGVIQACLLRAASPVELDYRIDGNYSRQMADVINSVVQNWDNDQGEAVLEFLMALWSGRMKLNDQHLKEVKTKSLQIEDLAAELKFILEQLV